VPDYYDIIKQPMSLSLMREKVTLGAYLCTEDLLADFRLMASNAREYNPKDDKLHLAERVRSACLHRVVS
jgi:hypothetical protein